MVDALQAKAGYSGAASPWKIQRRGIEYTIATEVCVFDDPKDNVATLPPANVCSPQAPVPASAGPVEPEIQPDDFRRVTVTLTWDTGTGSKSLKQIALVNNPSGGLGPRITQFDPPSLTAQLSSGNVATFPTTTTTAGSVRWNTDGTPNGSGDATGGTTSWTTSWYSARRPRASTRRRAEPGRPSTTPRRPSSTAPTRRPPRRSTVAASPATRAPPCCR